MSPDEFLVGLPAGRPKLSSTPGWMGECESTLNYGGLTKLGLMGQVLALA